MKGELPHKVGSYRLTETEYGYAYLREAVAEYSAKELRTAQTRTRRVLRLYRRGAMVTRLLISNALARDARSWRRWEDRNSPRRKET